MIKTYTHTMTMTNEELQKATVKLYISEGVKWNNPGEEKEVKYTGLKSWSVVTGEDAVKIEAESDGSCIDEYHEYLVLEFVDGTTSTFRNSHVDMFIR